MFFKKMKEAFSKIKLNYFLLLLLD